MNSGISPILAESRLGKAYFCQCRKCISILFKERWFRFDVEGVQEFRRTLQNLLLDSSMMEVLISEAMTDAARNGRSASGIPTRAEFGELLGLIDSALFVLEAQSIAAGQGISPGGLNEA